MTQTILVIDDEADIRQLTAMILELAGYTVLQADNGPDGLALLAEQPVDLVVLDIMMPGMDGWEVCRHIRALAKTRQLPVLILTVRNQPLDREIGLHVVGASGYLTKPYNRQELLGIVRDLLQSFVAAGEEKGE